MMNALTRREALAGIGTLAISATASRALAQQDAPTSAPAAAQNGAGFYRFRVGQIECYSIGDSQGRLPAYPYWGENASEEAVTAALRTALIQPDAMLINFSPLLFKIGSEWWLVDAGNGGNPTNPGQLLRHLGTIGVKPADITGVVLSHLHFDHFQGLFDAADKLVFANAKYFVNKVEHDFWSGKPDLSRSSMSEQFKQLITNSTAKALAALTASGKLQIVGDGEKLSTGLSVHRSGGHTPGHQTVALESGGEKFEMLVDVAHHHIMSMRHPDWHVQFDFDPREGARVRRATLERVSREQTKVMLYHTPWPGIGYVMPDRDAYAWLPVAWEW